MQIPASDPNVIGVAATNKNGNRSCYSDKGEVAAPGGDGGADLQDPNNTCVSRVNSWTDSPGPNAGPVCDVNHPEDCSYFLISLAKTDHGLQYVYWSGTSFAAPLVSGMAALAFEELEKNQVICLINGGASHAAAPDPELGSGIINIGDSLNPTFLPHCP
jgi:subtilisin family serine protease